MHSLSSQTRQGFKEHGAALYDRVCKDSSIDGLVQMKMQVHLSLCKICCAVVAFASELHIPKSPILLDTANKGKNVSLSTRPLAFVLFPSYRSDAMSSPLVPACPTHHAHQRIRLARDAQGAYDGAE